MRPNNRTKIIDFIKSFQSPFGPGYGPMQKQIAEAIGISHVAVHQHIKALEAEGVVVRRAKVEVGKARLICLAKVAA